MILERSLSASQISEVLASWVRHDIGVGKPGERYSVHIAFITGSDGAFAGASVQMEKVAVETGVVDE